ncbi:hypothetical protein LOK49_LG03G00518 [Camellia lanceoleosa]|uniref:Uncharacterized protein n=1 Tax=Camellia lanceoleosa TaxID=1840588 RepID=A0ACC0I8A5_9ERIC|nr:hypothetical protein LOK49_LG03G00518 [Camellia lanceoleosa]
MNEIKNGRDRESNLKVDRHQIRAYIIWIRKARLSQFQSKVKAKKTIGLPFFFDDFDLVSASHVQVCFNHFLFDGYASVHFVDVKAEPSTGQMQ